MDETYHNIVCLKCYADSKYPEKNWTGEHWIGCENKQKSLFEGIKKALKGSKK